MKPKLTEEERLDVFADYLLDRILEKIQEKNDSESAIAKRLQISHDETNDYS